MSSEEDVPQTLSGVVVVLVLGGSEQQPRRYAGGTVRRRALDAGTGPQARCRRLAGPGRPGPVKARAGRLQPPVDPCSNRSDERHNRRAGPSPARGAEPTRGGKPGFEASRETGLLGKIGASPVFPENCLLGDSRKEVLPDCGQGRILLAR